MMKVDLNSDLGESFGAWTMGDDEGVLGAVSSANVATGFHAGDPLVMRRTVELCAARGVAVGAHVSYPDLIGFGRRDMSCSPDEVYAYCVYQIGALAAFCRAAGTRVAHVKAHGALYNRAAQDSALAGAIARATRDAAGSDAILMGLANSEFEAAAVGNGIRFAAEAYADRAYMPDGSLVPRKRAGAVIHDTRIAAARVVGMVRDGTVASIDGDEIKLSPNSICMHGDTPEAVAMARGVRAALESAGIEIAPLSEVI